MLYLTKCADGSIILKKSSSTPGVEYTHNPSFKGISGSYRMLSASIVTVPSVSFHKKRTSLKHFATTMDMRVSFVIWIGVIVLTLFVTVIVASMLLRNYFQKGIHG